MSNLLNKGMFTSATDDWATPLSLFQPLHEEFGFTLDVCALPHNAKCPNYFTPEVDGLRQDWQGVCWMNPPYGRGIHHWVRKAHDTAQAGHVVVGLLPARTDTQWFHEYINGRYEVRFLPGRIYFERKGKVPGPSDRAPFPSMVVVFRKGS